MKDRIVELWHLPLKEIAKQTGLSVEVVRKRGARLGLPPHKINSQNRTMSAEQEVERDVKVASLGKRYEKTDAKYKLVLAQKEELERKLEVFQATRDVNTYAIRSRATGAGSEATAVVLASDWHWSETVSLESVNGLNKYDTTIARARADLFFHNIVKLVEIFKKDIEIHNLILALLGDFISGNIHDELMENNSELPIDEIIGVQNTLASGIQYILDNTKLVLTIPCHPGNHGRITKERRVSTEHGNSLEFLMYHNLADHFKGNKRVNFIIPRSYLSYINVEGYELRFHHGHALKYAGGVGGIFIPAFKSISQWDKAKRADLDCFAHFHQVKDGGKFICNGSLVGYNSYAMSIKADFEKPKQVFFLVDHKRKEKTVTTPVFVE